MSFDFSTASGINIKDALQNEGILSKGTHFGSFSLSHNFIEKIAVNSRIDNRIPDENTLGREAYSFSELENRAFSVTMREAQCLAQKMGVELQIGTDAIGNLFIRVDGQNQETHMVGSHLDSVKNGGKYDGPAGIAVGLEILQQALYHKREGMLQNSFCLTVFRSEESGPNNGVACLGSAVATGKITKEKLESIIYKNENGSDVLLKDHLESSLRRYFQAVGTDKRGDKGEILWGEGDEYIDHEWWYFFCEQHKLSQEDYSSGAWWEKICNSLNEPKISQNNTQSYHELHIEQGTLIEHAQVDGIQVQFGIVSGGIGGAKRYKTVDSIAVESREVSPQDYEVYSFEIYGFSDHTGSTPNNLDVTNSEYRKDAQIAINLFLSTFLEQDFGELISSKAENDEGFTKVPYQQRVKLAIKKNKNSTAT